MRALHKAWQNRRPGWTRRVRWYEGPEDIRLQFEDELGKANLIYERKVVATKAYEAFIAGKFTTQDLRELV